MVKGNKILNPADKARREARKKELKKNKKQRQQVRSAAIESRDPEQIITELEKLDKLEFDVTTTNPTISDSFYKDKRKRLKETLSKILLYYQKEDTEKYNKLKKLELDYDNKYSKQLKDFEAIKAAQDVKIEDIFLPPELTSTTTTNAIVDEIPDDDPLLSESIYITSLTEGIKPPGCPPGLPPDLLSIVNNIKMAKPPIPIEQAQYRPYIPRLSRKTNNQFNKNITKAAVIESKPIIFKPKITKFIPSSVRSKV